MFLLSFFAFFLQFCLDGPYNFGLLSKTGNPNPQTSLYFSVHVYFKLLGIIYW